MEHLALRMPAGTTSVVLVGYGPQTTRPAIAAIAEVLTLMTPVTGRYLYDDGRFFCLTPHCDCTPATGVQVDPRSTVTAAKLAVAGLTVAPSASSLQSFVAADPGAQADTQTALNRLGAGYTLTEADLIRLIGQAESGHPLTADDVAQLAAALQDRRLLIAAWRHTGDQVWQCNLWFDVARRSPDDYAAAPANLAAWSAWRRGEDALASAAHDQARTLAPGNGITKLIGWLLGAHIPAHHVPWPSTTSLDTSPVEGGPR
jgi:hypothetical protein